MAFEPIFISTLLLAHLGTIALLQTFGLDAFEMALGEKKSCLGILLLCAAVGARCVFI